jgi:dUTPase
VVARCERLTLTDAPAASATRRGARGFGSTGRRGESARRKAR